MFPIYLFILSWPLVWLATDEWGGWPVLAAYVFNLIGSRFAGWWYGHYLDWKGKCNAQTVYSNPDQAAAWSDYIASVKSHLNA